MLLSALINSFFEFYSLCEFLVVRRDVVALESFCKLKKVPRNLVFEHVIILWR